MKKLIILILATVLAVPAAAQTPRPITTAEFLARAEPLMKKSKVTLMFSSEAKTLMAAVGAAAKATRARQDADRAAGRKPAMCLPPQGKAEIEAGALIAYLKGLPPAEQSRSLNDGFAGYAARKYPCPKS